MQAVCAHKAKRRKNITLIRTKCIPVADKYNKILQLISLKRPELTRRAMNCTSICFAGQQPSLFQMMTNAVHLEIACSLCFVTNSRVHSILFKFILLPSYQFRLICYTFSKQAIALCWIEPNNCGIEDFSFSDNWPMCLDSLCWSLLQLNPKFIIASGKRDKTNGEIQKHY